MTRRRIALLVPNGGYLVTPEFNGDRRELIQSGSRDSCDLDWPGIAAIFTKVWNTAAFEVANSVAQNCFHSCLGNAPTPCVRHTSSLSHLACDELYLVGGGEMIKVETHKAAVASTADEEGYPHRAQWGDTGDTRPAPCILTFHYADIGGEPGSTIYVLLQSLLTDKQVACLEDSISSYIDSHSAWGYEALIHDVLSAEGYDYIVLAPRHTFLI